MAAMRKGAEIKGMRPENPRYRAGLGALARALKLKPSLLSLLSDLPLESLWQRCDVCQLTGLMLNSLLVVDGLNDIKTEEARV